MVAMLLGGDVSYAYDSSVNTPVPKSEQSEQYIPPPHYRPKYLFVWVRLLKFSIL